MIDIPMHETTNKDRRPRRCSSASSVSKVHWTYINQEDGRKSHDSIDQRDSNPQ